MLGLPRQKRLGYWSKVLDYVEDTLNWLYYRTDAIVEKEIRETLVLIVDAVIERIEELSRMVVEGKKYFES